MVFIDFVSLNVQVILTGFSSKLLASEIATAIRDALHKNLDLGVFRFLRLIFQLIEISFG